MIKFPRIFREILLLSITFMMINQPSFGANRGIDIRLGNALLNAYIESKVILDLIQKGADPDAELIRDDNRMLRPLHIAVLYQSRNQEQKEILQLLLSHGANVNGTDSEGNTALHRAAGEANATAIDILMKNSANVFAKNNEGNTILHKAVFGTSAYLPKNLEARNFLFTFIKSGININEPNHNGETALYTAVESEKPWLIQLLLDYGADPTLLKQDTNSIRLRWKEEKDDPFRDQFGLNSLAMPPHYVEAGYSEVLWKWRHIPEQEKAKEPLRRAINQRKISKARLSEEFTDTSIYTDQE